MDFIRLAKVKDFERTHVRSYKLLARHVGIFKRRDGSFYAMEVSCKHQNADLTTGPIRDGIATCPRHGWKYNLRTGECVYGASKAPLRRYRLKVEGGNIFVSLHPLPEGVSEEEHEQDEGDFDGGMRD